MNAVIVTVTTSVILLCLGPVRSEALAEQTAGMQVSLRAARDSAPLGRFYILSLGLWCALLRLRPLKLLDGMSRLFGFWKVLSSVLFISDITVPGSSEPFMTQGQMPNSSMQDMYNQSPSGAMSNLGMGQRQQFPYGASYDRR